MSGFKQPKFKIICMKQAIVLKLANMERRKQALVLELENMEKDTIFR